MKKIKQLLSDARILMFILTILNIGFCSFVLLKPYNTKMVVIDMAKVLERPALLLSRTNLSQKKQAEFMKNYAKNLPFVIKTYGEKYQLTIISGTVLSNYNDNDNDITPIIVKEAIKRVKNEYAM